LHLFRPHVLGADPGRDEVGRVLLVERLAGDAVGVAREHEGTVLQVRQEPRRYGFVIREEVGFGVTLAGPEDFPWIADRAPRRPAGVPASNGDPARASGRSVSISRRNVFSSKPVPTLET